MTDPWALLGLERSATEAEVGETRRRLARESHPDLGGDVTAMQAINAAADQVLAALRTGSSSPNAGPTNQAERHRAGRRHERRGHPWRDSSVDHPSFTIEALPVDAFEALVLVGSELGTIVDDDQPYRLEFRLEGDIRAWCEVTLVPDAGSTTVSVAVAAEPGYPRPTVEQVRDLLVEGLNRLDWADGPNQPPP
jgi:hypothetical protein